MPTPFTARYRPPVLSEFVRGSADAGAVEPRPVPPAWPAGLEASPSFRGLSSVLSLKRAYRSLLVAADRDAATVPAADSPPRPSPRSSSVPIVRPALHAVRWADDWAFGCVSAGLAGEREAERCLPTKHPPGNPVFCASSCHWCGSALSASWQLPDVYATCPRCQLSHVALPRHVDIPSVLWPVFASAVNAPTPTPVSSAPSVAGTMAPSSGNPLLVPAIPPQPPTLTVDPDANARVGEEGGDGSLGPSLTRNSGGSEFVAPRVWDPRVAHSLSSVVRTGAPTTTPSYPVTGSGAGGSGGAALDDPLADAPLPVADFRWASLRTHPDNPFLVAVCQNDRVLRWDPHRHVAFVRANLLARWQKYCDHRTRFNEADVAAFVVALVLECPHSPLVSPSDIPSSFAGESHEFMPWNALTDPGIFRPASVSRTPHVGPALEFDRHTSAFRSVAGLKAPLDAEAHRRLFAWHPDGPTLCNNIAFGFSTLANLPDAPRWAPKVGGGKDSNPTAQRDLLAAVDKEVTEDAFVVASREHAAMARGAPFMAVPKPDGSFRGVSDLSWGTDSVNATTHRPPVPRARLADSERLLLRIRYMQQTRPGDPVLLSKFDAARAFRQCAVPWRELLLAAHFGVSATYLNSRLTMGGKASGDLMSVGISLIRDLLAAEFGIYAETYIDDMLVVMYASEAARVVAIVERLWRYLGWPFNERKFAEESAPAPVRKFLGWTVDTARRVVFMDDEHLAKIQSTISSWLLGTVHPTPKMYSQLAGRLQFIAKLFPFGRVFIRSLYKRGYGALRNVNLAAPIPDDVRADLEWWEHALGSLNGAASFAEDSEGTVIHAYTDASGTGWGAVAHSIGQFACGRWDSEQRRNSSTAHWEAIAILNACWLWGRRAEDGTLHVHTDSFACVGFLRSMSAHDPQLYLVLRVVALLQLRWRFALRVSHVPGVENVDADYLSRHLRPNPPLAAFAKCAETDSMRICGSILRVSRSLRESPDQSHLTQLCATLHNTVATSATQSRADLRWIPWKWALQQPWAVGGSSTFAAGWKLHTRTYLATRCRATSPRSVLASRLTSASTIPGLRPWTPTSSDAARTCGSAGTKCPSRAPSSLPSHATSRSLLACALRSSWRGSTCFASRNTPPFGPQPPDQSVSSCDGTSPVPRTAAASSSTSHGLSLILSIRGRPLYLCRGSGTLRALSQPCAGTCRRRKRDARGQPLPCSASARAMASPTSPALTSTRLSSSMPASVVCQSTWSPLIQFASVVLLN